MTDRQKARGKQIQEYRHALTQRQTNIQKGRQRKQTHPSDR